MNHTLKAIIKEMASLVVLTIMNGPLKKYKFISGSGLVYILGKYEEKTVEFFKNNVKEGFCCYDIGGHVGYLSLVLAKFAGMFGNVIVFEPRSINIKYIEKHISLNRIQNIVLLPLGVSDFEGEATFSVQGGTGTGRISDKGSLRINVDTLDNLIQKGEIKPPDFIKMDIEGEELKALKGGRILLTRYSPVLNISTHGKELHAQCIEFVREIGYKKIEEIEGGFTAFF